MTESYRQLQQGSPLRDAVDCFVALINGQLATTIAVLAVAFIGYQMMLGRIPVKRAFQAILGCFVLFGSPGIARSIMDFTDLSPRFEPAVVYRAGPSYAVPTPALNSSANPFDPYASRPPSK